MRATRWILAPILGIPAVMIAPSTAAAAKNDPVLLVHGWRGSPSTWAEMIDRRQASPAARQKRSRCPARTTSRTPSGSATSSPKGADVDIVGQSMGGLSARYFIKTIGTGESTRTWHLEPPSTATRHACCSLLAGWPDARRGHSCAVSILVTTRRPTYSTTIYSRTDGVVPNNSSRLDGGACHVFEDPGVPHNDMDNNDKIFAHVLDATNRTCDGTFRTT